MMIPFDGWSTVAGRAQRRRTTTTARPRGAAPVPMNGNTPLNRRDGSGQGRLLTNRLLHRGGVNQRVTASGAFSAPGPHIRDFRDGKCRSRCPRGWPVRGLPGKGGLALPVPLRVRGPIGKLCLTRCRSRWTGCQGAEKRETRARIRRKRTKARPASSVPQTLAAVDAPRAARFRRAIRKGGSSQRGIFREIAKNRRLRY